jgi:diguanylate cyclase (GGDEF)-like protein/PAS domain S-box-containing protein
MDMDYEQLMYFVYGLSFFALGLAVFLYPRRASELRLAKGLWLVGLFGLLHGLNEWMEMLARTAWSPEDPPFAVFKVVLLPASFLCLTLYGSVQIQMRRGRSFSLAALPVVLMLCWMAAVLFSERRLLAADVWARYLLAVPGTLLAALAIRMNVPAWKKTQKKTFIPDIRMIVIISLAYGVLAGLVVPEAGFFPASVFNYRFFREGLGIPVQVFRAACAVAVTFFILRALRVFDWEARASLAESEKKYRFLFQNMVNAVAYQKIASVDPGGRVEPVLIEVNDSFESLFGVRREEVLGKNVVSALPGTKENFRALLDLYEQAAWTGEEGRADLYFEPLKKWISVSAYSPKESFFVTVFEDVTKRKRREQELSSMALSDDLTGLHNRRGFTALAEHQLKRTERSGTTLLLVFADLDDLKEINDTHGHAAGDRALAGFAAVLRKTFRGSDILARIGGDEFAVLTTETPEADDRTLTARLQVNLDAHNAAGNRPYLVSASVGVIRHDPKKPRGINELLNEADQIMYANKRNRRNNHQNARTS